jgi:N-acyl-D-aspartate/D-glutamate deacylase
MADVTEIVIAGGTVVDGTGAPARLADVRIADGRIVEIGPGLRAGRHGDRVLDAAGALVTPGFVDIHTHYDAQVFWDPWLTPSCFQGVTTVVAGHCGLSLAPCREAGRDLMVRTLHFVEDMSPATLAQGVDWSWEDFPTYRRRVGEHGVGVNLANYVGHTAVRLWVMGEDGYDREAKPDEVAAMAAVVGEAVRAGAIGFSTDRSSFHAADGGRPVPSVTASQEETEALFRAAAAAGGIGAAIVDDDPSWLYRIQPELGVPLTWCQILGYPDSSPRAPWAEAQLALHRKEFAAGTRVHPQATCRPITFQVSFAQPMVLYPVPAFGELSAMTVDERAARYRDPAWRERAVRELGSRQWVDPNWEKFRVAETGRHTALVGRTLADVAAERGEEPLATALDLTLEDGMATRFDVVFANDDVDLLTRVLNADGCLLGLSDAGAHNAQMCDAGLAVDFLANWVRDRDLMPIEQGVRKVSGELADFLGLADRGTLEVGRAADVVVLDLADLDPGPLRRVTDFPAGSDRLTADAPRGLRHVLVNGAAARVDGRDTRHELDALPGQLLRR